MYIHKYTYVCVSVLFHVCMVVHAFICRTALYVVMPSMCLYAFNYVQMCVCVCSVSVCLYIKIHTHMHTYIFIYM